MPTATDYAEIQIRTKLNNPIVKMQMERLLATVTELIGSENYEVVFTTKKNKVNVKVKLTNGI